MYIMALAAGAILAFSVLFASSTSGRLAFSPGNLSNPNALAAYLLLTVPFCFFIFLQSKKIAVKALASLVTLMLLGMTLRTGSRSGLVSIRDLSAYIFFSASVPKKILMATLSIALMISSPLYLPDSVLARFRTLMGQEAQISSGGDEDERQADFAEGSTHSRSYLLRKSIDFTLANPVFGVGPGMFAVASSDEAKAEGDPALWQQTHNTYTQVSSETGLPGLAIYLGLILAILNATRMPAWAKTDPEFSLLHNTALTLRLSLIAFCGGAMFGSFAYNMELPLLAGLAETLRRVLESRKHQTQVVRISRNLGFHRRFRCGRPSIKLRRIQTMWRNCWNL